MKAIALMSGGLDSNLAVRLVHDMGIEISGVHFTGPFCQCNRGKGGCINYAAETARKMGIPFKVVSLGEEYIDVVVSAKHGYGSGANPCIDCRILMFSKAKEMMCREDASFVVTGEVLGQRPMSQLKEKLVIIERESGLEGLIVRPLCGQHVPETIPEKEGWIERDRLLAIKGRRRREQMDLAELLEIGDYPCPAGGCLLTDKHFARRVKDAIAHEGLRLQDIALLKIGRHFRLEDDGKLVVGRNLEENTKIENMVHDGDVLMVPENVVGPTALLRMEGVSEESVGRAAGIVASYCDGVGPVVVSCRKNGEIKTIECGRMDREFCEGRI
jgi:tRNA U34 2-thiouridine synthase MnmA/TrmU